MMNCAKCGREITSCTTVNGLIVCDWCKPAPTNFEKARDEETKVIAETHNPRWNTTVHNDLFIDCAKAGADWAKEMRKIASAE